MNEILKKKDADVNTCIINVIFDINKLEYEKNSFNSCYCFNRNICS